MKKFLALLSIAFVLITPVFAQYGLEETATAANLASGPTEPTVIVGRIIGAGLSLIGIVFFILTLYAGIVWMVARGNEESAKKAINTIIAAAIGMIITMSAYAITSFILDAANESALGSGGGRSAPTVVPTDPKPEVPPEEAAEPDRELSGGGAEESGESTGE